jgi:sialate O-acetylesterase
MNPRLRFVVGLVATTSASVLFTVSAAKADVKLPSVLGSHMVLQRDVPIPVWGTAEAGEAVTVTLGSDTSSTKADAQGKWKVQLPARQVGGPLELTVTGKNKVELKDILVGEVWVCSGQSNMEWHVANSDNPDQEIAAANHPQIRLIKIPKTPAGSPQEDVPASWTTCTSETIPQFSAVAYFFGRNLNQELNIPIGLINTSWGGTRIEPWTPPVGFEGVPEVSSILVDVLEEYRQAKIAAIGKIRDWTVTAQKQADAGDEISAPPAWPQDPIAKHTAPTGLYNGMVHPLLPFPVRGAIWYQGESNLADGLVYHHKMKALIHGWRTVWNNPEMPFLFVQLAPYRYGNADKSQLALVWEAQTETLAVPNTGMAVTNDVGNVKDIHPRNKQDVGKRLALWALSKTYDREGMVYSGPLYKSSKVEGKSIRIQFDHTGTGLVSRDGKPLREFTIAGDDGEFVEAMAEIDGDSVVVHSDKVAKPTAVRFAWHDSAEPNLSNKEGLPASSFRTKK